MLQPHFSVCDMSELQINWIIATENTQLGLMWASMGPKGFISKAFAVYMSPYKSGARLGSSSALVSKSDKYWTTPCRAGSGFSAVICQNQESWKAKYPYACIALDRDSLALQVSFFYGLAVILLHWVWISRDVSLHHRPQNSKVHLLPWDGSKCKCTSEVLPWNMTSWHIRVTWSALRAVLGYFCRTSSTRLCEAIQLHLHDELQGFWEGSDTWDGQTQSSSWSKIRPKGIGLTLFHDTWEPQSHAIYQSKIC